jgi:hypothetical protein
MSADGEYPLYRPAAHHGPNFRDPRWMGYKGLAVGQRVIASTQFGPPLLGVISAVHEDHYSVQFAPCGCHWSVGTYVSPFGDANGWTNREYRVARELAYCRESADNIERERRAKYPAESFTVATLFG